MVEASDLLTALAGFGWFCILAVIAFLIWLVLSVYAGRRGP